ncbi:MAG: hypothetical protein RBR87_09205 [Bacteroidales bacterium]|jgi:hypothetical protein|nr:hypothetical protein [Bacteroidales bacterium]
MSKTLRHIVNTFYGLIVLFATLYVSSLAYDYYATPLESRFFHPSHEMFKPSGSVGHGLGILGSLLMIIGVAVYMARKRLRVFRRLGLLKHWLEFHIFLCTLGPILVLFHTAFKFGGIVSISFWSMVAVFASGVIGRFIYLQIPHTIEGRMMSRSDIYRVIADTQIRINQHIDSETIKNELFDIFETLSSGMESDQPIAYKTAKKQINSILKQGDVDPKTSREVLHHIKHDFSLRKRIKRLELMQNLFRYWHVIHLPFAILMLLIMIIHVVVTLLFGYTWIL